MNRASHKHKQSTERYRVRHKQTVAVAEHHINKSTQHIPQHHNITHNIQKVGQFTGGYTSIKTIPGTLFYHHRLLVGERGGKGALSRAQNIKVDFNPAPVPWGLCDPSPL